MELVKFKTDEEYYADREYVTNSQLGYLNRSPQHLQMYYDGDGDNSPALDIGRLVHQYILEPEKVSENDIVCFEGRKYGKKWDDFKSKNSDKTILSTKDFQSINGMVGSFFKNDNVVDLIADGLKEVTNCWVDGDTFVKCKGKADVLNPNGIVDIKTTANIDHHSFRNSCYKYGYNRQAAFYCDGFGVENFTFICVEKEAPYRIAVYECSPEFIESGRQEYKRLLQMYFEYFVEQSNNVEDYYIEGVL